MSETIDPLLVGAPQPPLAHRLHLMTSGAHGTALRGEPAETQPSPQVAGRSPQSNAAPNSAPSPPAATAPLLAWLQKIAASETRGLAIESLTAALADYYRPASVRIITGRGAPKRMHDPRLGWLSRESDLWPEANQLWDGLQFDGNWHSGRAGEAVIGFTASTPGSDRCMIWISGSGIDPSVTDPMRQPLQILMQLIVKLPRRSLPAWTSLLGVHWRGVLMSAAAIVVIAACLPIQYPVVCTARVEPARERFVTAPFEAMLLTCDVRPGDAVQRDQVLFELDGRPLRLERESVKAELDQATKDRDVALAGHRIAEAQQAELRQRQLAHRAQLLDDRLARLKVRSPIDGIVVSGDLDRYVGSPLETGQTLVEIAPLDRLSIEVEIPEFEIGYVEEGAPTRVRFPAAGGESIRDRIRHVSPAAELREDRNVFIARIEVENFDRGLRPGMRGDATAYGPRRPMFWRHGRMAWERFLWWSGY